MPSLTSALRMFLLLLLLPAWLSAEEMNVVDRDQALARLSRMKLTQWGMMNIAKAEGQWFEQLVQQIDAKKVVEIGTSNGYSAIWLALGLAQTGGKLITLEIDDGRYKLAQENFSKAGVSHLIDARLTDALAELERIEGPIDLVFIDAWKDDYPRYLELVLPKVRPGGMIAAHNVENLSGEEGIRRYRELVDNHPQLETRYVHEGSAGIALSTKKAASTD